MGAPSVVLMPLREAGEVHGGRIARDHHVGLERGEPARHHLPAERGDVVVGAQRRRAQHVAHARPRRPAVRPVQAHAVAQRPAEELVDRHAERLGLDVPQRQLDAGHRLVGHAAQVLPRGAQHVPVQPLDRPRVLADQQRGQVAHRARDAVRAAVVAAFAPAHEPVVGLDADEGPGPPAAVTVQRLHACDLHGERPCHSRPARTRRIAARRSLGRPGRGAPPELLQGEQPDPRIGARGGPRRLGVVAPRGEEERHVVQIGMRGHVLERLEPVLDEGQPRPPPARGGPRRRSARGGSGTCARRSPCPARPRAARPSGRGCAARTRPPWW